MTGTVRTGSTAAPTRVERWERRAEVPLQQGVAELLAAFAPAPE